MKRRLPTRLIALSGASFLLVAHLSLAGDKVAPSSNSTKKPKTESTATSQAGAARPARAGLGAMSIQWPGIDLPAYQPPEAYSVDFVVHSPDGEMVLKRSIDKGRIRTDMNADGHDIVMIEMGDEKGTMYTLMPEQKRAMKTSMALMHEMTDKRMPKKPKVEEAEAVPPDVKIEDLGDETLDGRAVKKLRMSVTEGSALGWFDKATGAPVRFESTTDGKKTSMDWKNYKAAPQPEKLFVVPKGYEVTDMEEAMSQMKGMGGMTGMAGGMAGMAGGMAGGMAQSFGQSMGASMGASLGGALGGPIGSIAGQYIGGRVGGMIAKKAADVVIPGK